MRVSYPISRVTSMVIRNHLSVVPDLPSSPEVDLTIDCKECVARHSDACSDCVVSYIVSKEPGQPNEFERGEANAMRLLADAGLVPGSRFVREQPVA